MRMKIESNIPLPPLNGQVANRTGKGKWQVALNAMKVGDSMGGLTINQCKRVYALAREMGITVTRRKMGRTYRVWKTRNQGHKVEVVL